MSDTACSCHVFVTRSNSRAPASVPLTDFATLVDRNTSFRGRSFARREDYDDLCKRRREQSDVKEEPDDVQVIHTPSVSLQEIQSSFDKKTKEPGFLKLSSAEVLALLREDFLTVSSEAEVYQAVMRWCQHSYPFRWTKEMFDTLLTEVRWDLIPDVLQVATVTATNPLRQTLIELKNALFPSNGRLTVEPRERHFTEKVLLFFSDRNQTNLRIFDWRTKTVSPVSLPAEITARSSYKDMGPVANNSVMFRLLREDHVEVYSYSLEDKTVKQLFIEKFTGCEGYPMVLLNGKAYGWNFVEFKRNGNKRSDGTGLNSALVSKFSSNKVNWPKYHRLEAAFDCWNDERLYLCGGTTLDNRDTVNVVKVFSSMSGEWSSLSKMHKPRHCFAAIICDNVLYVSGGAFNRDNGQVGLRKSCERLNLKVSNAFWEPIADLADLRYQHSMFVADGRVYVCGGYTFHGVAVDYMETYDPQRNRWDKVMTSQGSVLIVEPVTACAIVTTCCKPPRA